MLALIRKEEGFYVPEFASPLLLNIALKTSFKNLFPLFKNPTQLLFLFKTSFSKKRFKNPTEIPMSKTYSFFQHSMQFRVSESLGLKESDSRILWLFRSEFLLGEYSEKNCTGSQKILEFCPPFHVCISTMDRVPLRKQLFLISLPAAASGIS